MAALAESQRKHTEDPAQGGQVHEVEPHRHVLGAPLTRFLGQHGEQPVEVHTFN